MIRSIAAALAAFALISFGVRAEEAAKAPKAEAAKADVKEDKAENKAEKKAEKKEHHKKEKAEKKADK